MIPHTGIAPFVNVQTKAKVAGRLARIEGQIRGVAQMAPSSAAILKSSGKRVAERIDVFSRSER
jgi:hypothetical protein